MMRYAYAARPTRGAKEAMLRFRDLPQIDVRGRGPGEAMVKAKAALEAALWAMVKQGKSPPRPSAPKRGDVMIAVTPSVAAKLAFVTAFKHSDINQSELGRRLALNHREVQRMLDPTRKTKIDRLNAALNLLGRRIVIAVEDS